MHNQLDCKSSKTNSVYDFRRRSVALTALAAGALLVGGLNKAALAQAPGGMALVWSDEFTGASNNASPSGANWNYDTGGGGWGNNELEVYTSNWDNAHMIWDGTGTDNQALQIKATNGGGTWYSARLKTAGKVSFGPYGYYETRCKFPNAGKGYWPAFWFLGNNIGSVGWPSCGEIDVAEEIDGQWENHQSLHMPGWDPSLVTSSNSSTTTYHNYGANWQPGYVTFYVDGNQTGTFSRGGGGAWEFDGQTMYMLLNCAVGGNWPGNPDGSTQGTGYFDVDYVRQYEYIGDTLYQNMTLTSGGQLVNGSHTCRMQSDGNLVVYNGNSPLWASGTSGNAGAYCTMQSDGNLVIYNTGHGAIWATNTSGNPGASCTMQSDGNFVLYNSRHGAVWATGTFGR